ncbi:hypothetical protein [Schleiferilactobacillus harbinensis]|uniref:hypothetical protein n=1 Tax=Schleiferilactobacillus harbinensis TaxID=304207 RepID=UPI0007B84F5B|nr:hypothetical protein [Schleiferilactobacillus harbinensis]
MSNIDEQIVKFRTAAKVANAKAKRLEKEKRQHTIMVLGRHVLKETKAASVAELEERFTITPKGSSALSPEIQQQLTNLADKMEWTSHYWRMQNLPEVGEFLSQFRTRKQS